MKNSAALSILFFALCFTIKAQTGSSDVSLFNVQCKAGESVCHTQEIVRYDFKNGEFASKETIFSAETKDVRFDLGGNRIYQNRYIVNRTGGIFDIQTRKILGDSRGSLVDMIGDDLFFEVSRIDLNGIFAFNLKTEKYRKLPAKNIFEAERILSPDKKRAVVWENGGGNAFQFYEAQNNWKSKKAVKVNGSFSASCSERCSSMMKVPFIWLDNERILTQQSNGEIITININGKIEPVVEIEIDEQPDSLPHFSKNEYGNISYYCGGTGYSLDIKNKTFVKDKAIIGDDFESVNGGAFRSEYFYKGKSIGRIWSGGSSIYKGFLAVKYAKEGKNLGRPDGIKVWNDLRNDWITLEVDWGVNIVGWLEK